jgi:hypothetical protein
MIQMKNNNLPKVVNIQLPEELLSELESIKSDASSDFGKAHKDGVEISGNIYRKFRGVITSWRKYHYKWTDGQKKEIVTGLSAEEALQGGYLPGADIIVESDGWRVAFSLPQSGYSNFARYTKHLERNGAEPHQVVTEISSVIVNFKAGAQPVLTFVPVAPAMANPQIIDVEATAVTTGPPTEVPPVPVTEVTSQSPTSSQENPWK